MRKMERTVRELLAAAQQERIAKLDAGRVDTVLKGGDRVQLRTEERLDAEDKGPFAVTACPSPNTYTLALPRKMVNVDRSTAWRSGGSCTTSCGGAATRRRTTMWWLRAEELRSG